ncbi:MAG: FAD-binding oxidoreductase [Rhizobiaceae bacterium]|nr:FAD-binding oxidoreductase [Rhizobiaceae bacterium]
MADQPTQTSGIIIIGAGIIGVSTALTLRRAGHAVTVFDPKGPAGGASFGNGGAMAASGILPLNTPGIVRRGLKMLADPHQPLFIKWRYLPKIAPWLMRFASHATPEQTERTAMALARLVMTSWSDHAALASGTPAERYLVRSDYAFIYPSRAAYEADAYGFALKRKAGIRWEEIEGARLKAYDPALAQTDGFGVVYDDGEHAILTDPGLYVEGLAAGFEALGGRIIRAAVDDIRVETDEQGRKRATGVMAGGAFHSGGTVLLAAGAWSKPLAAKLGLTLPLETERGYHLELWEPNVQMKRPLLVTQGKFVVTPMDGRIRCAGIDEFGGLAAGPSPEGPALLEYWVKRALPAIQWRRTTDWLGFRPTLPDSLPLIGRAPGIANTFLSFGHHHLGMTAGPKTGRLLAMMMQGEKINEDIGPFDPAKWVRR